MYPSIHLSIPVFIFSSICLAYPSASSALKRFLCSYGSCSYIHLLVSSLVRKLTNLSFRPSVHPIFPMLVYFVAGLSGLLLRLLVIVSVQLSLWLSVHFFVRLLFIYKNISSLMLLSNYSTISSSSVHLSACIHICLFVRLYLYFYLDLFICSSSHRLFWVILRLSVLSSPIISPFVRPPMQNVVYLFAYLLTYPSNCLSPIGLPPISSFTFHSAHSI